MTSNPRVAWLHTHREEIGELLKAAHREGKSHEIFLRHAVDRIMSMRTPPPGGRRDAAMLAQLFDVAKSF